MSLQESLVFKYSWAAEISIHLCLSKLKKELNRIRENKCRRNKGLNYFFIMTLGFTSLSQV